MMESLTRALYIIFNKSGVLKNRIGAISYYSFFSLNNIQKINITTNKGIASGNASKESVIRFWTIVKT